MFEHVEIDYPSLSRELIDGVRYYDTPDGQKLVSITSVISHRNRDKFTKWRKRVGEEEANKITKVATGRGTRFHDLVEQYLLNKDINTLEDVLPTTKALFLYGKKSLDNINNIALGVNTDSSLRNKLLVQLEQAESTNAFDFKIDVF